MYGVYCFHYFLFIIQSLRQYLNIHSSTFGGSNHSLFKQSSSPAKEMKVCACVRVCVPLCMCACDNISRLLTYNTDTMPGPYLCLDPHLVLAVNLTSWLIEMLLFSYLFMIKWYVYKYQCMILVGDCVVS